MANYTQDLILETFSNMLEQMPLEKITVTSLIKECNIGRNTFYYHYEDIYALVDELLLKSLGQYEHAVEDADWKSVMKSLLYACKDNKKKVYHLLNSLSRDRLEQYVFSRTNSFVHTHILQIAKEKNAAPERAEAIADIVKYSVYGLIIQFFLNGMESDIEVMVDKYGLIYDELLDKMLN